MERYSLIAARILISIIFLLNGLNIIGQTLAVHEMAAHGVPVSLIPVLIMGARTLQLVAGTGLAFGIYPRVSSLALLLFLIPATLMAHAFCEALTHCACFVNDSLSASSLFRADGDRRKTMPLIRARSGPGRSSQW
jgi:uncharacterized membrane protein YphA (DoxX/SURF4 family)